MLRKIRNFFDQRIQSGGAQAGDDRHALQLATAALLIEVMRADSDIHDAERHALTAAIQARFELMPEETAALLRLAEEEAAQATDYYQFTALINEHFTPAQKAQVIENMWRVAAADREIDRFERTLVHKVADLLHVPRATQIAARERALRGADRPSVE
jgi:uncharacterized tellurite resistance protein B-like protein